jgi:GT2 family glycosyltransferase
LESPNRPNPVEAYDSERYLKQQQYVEEENYAATANLFARKCVFDELGLFDATLQSGGDTEWGWRVTRQGYRICYADAVRVQHAVARQRRYAMFTS